MLASPRLVLCVVWVGRRHLSSQGSEWDLLGVYKPAISPYSPDRPWKGGSVSDRSDVGGL